MLISASVPGAFIRQNTVWTFFISGWVTIMSTVFRQINALCALTDTLVNSRGPGEYFRVFPANFAHFDQFTPILRVIFHQKVLGHVYPSQGIYLAKYGIWTFSWNNSAKLHVYLKKPVTGIFLPSSCQNTCKNGWHGWFTQPISSLFAQNWHECKANVWRLPYFAE